MKTPAFYDSQGQLLGIGDRVETDDYGPAEIIAWVEPDESHWGIEVRPLDELDDCQTIRCSIRDYMREGPDPDSCDMQAEDVQLVAA